MINNNHHLLLLFNIYPLMSYRGHICPSSSKEQALAKKLYTISDIHTEFLTEAQISVLLDLIQKKDNSILICPGDIGLLNNMDNINKYKQFMLGLGTKFDYIVYIIGNHEYYHNSFEVTNSVAKELSTVFNKQFDIPNKYNLLINESIIIDNYNFYGTTLWSKPMSKYESTNCIHLITDFKGSIKLYDDEFEKNKLWLTNQINNLNESYDNIIITHHLPSYKLIQPKYIMYKELNSFFASELDELIKNPIKCWIYGHTHNRFIKKINDIMTIVNPLGYISENGSLMNNYIKFHKKIDDDLVLEIKY